MKILTVANEKGGVGKTLLSVQFAFYCAFKFGLKVAVIDLDQQANASNSIRSNQNCVVSDTASSCFMLEPADLLAENLQKIEEAVKQSNLVCFPADDALSEIENSMSSDYDKISKDHLNKLCYDPIKISFKSCPHAIISLKKDIDESQVILPNVHLFNPSGTEIGYSSNIELPEEDVYIPWDNKAVEGEVSATYTLLPPRVDDRRINHQNLDYRYFDNLLIINNTVTILANKAFFEFTNNYNNLVLLLKNTSDNSITPYRMGDFTFSALDTPTKLGNPASIKLSEGPSEALIISFIPSYWTSKVILKIYDENHNLLSSIVNKDRRTCETTFPINGKRHIYTLT